MMGSAGKGTNKKTHATTADMGTVFFRILLLICFSFLANNRPIAQAGFLTSGSLYWSRLPD